MNKILPHDSEGFLKFKFKNKFSITRFIGYWGNATQHIVLSYVEHKGR